MKAVLHGPMPAHTVNSKLIFRAVLMGIVSLAAYLLIFLNQDAVTHYFTEGGFMTAVVVITALAFSVVHGTFAHCILEIFGVEALIKKDKKDQ